MLFLCFELKLQYYPHLHLICYYSQMMRRLEKVMKVQMLHQNYEKGVQHPFEVYSKKTFRLFKFNTYKNLNDNQLRQYKISNLGFYVYLNVTVTKTVTI